MITTHALHSARLKNNYPVCFANDGLEFSFTQESITKNSLLGQRKGFQKNCIVMAVKTLSIL